MTSLLIKRMSNVINNNNHSKRNSSRRAKPTASSNPQMRQIPKTIHDTKQYVKSVIRDEAFDVLSRSGITGNYISQANLIIQKEVDKRFGQVLENMDVVVKHEAADIAAVVVANFKSAQPQQQAPGEEGEDAEGKTSD